MRILLIETEQLTSNRYFLIVVKYFLNVRYNHNHCTLSLISHLQYDRFWFIAQFIYERSNQIDAWSGSLLSVLRLDINGIDRRRKTVMNLSLRIHSSRHHWRKPVDVASIARPISRIRQRIAKGLTCPSDENQYTISFDIESSNRIMTERLPK